MAESKVTESSKLLPATPARGCCGRVSTDDLVRGRSGSLKGKVAIVTGANVGLGKDTARGLALLGAHVILAGRSLEKLEQAKIEIAAAVQGAELTVLKVSLDLSSFKSIAAFANHFLEQNLPLHFLINNAGLFGNHSTTKDGLDLVAGTNWFGGFYLTHLLLDKLKASAPSRIINVASRSHHRAGEVTDTELILHPTAAQFSRSRAYGNSKLLNILHGHALAKRLSGTGVTAYSMHPGLVYTNIPGGLGSWASTLCGLMCCWGHCPCIRSVDQGSSTIVYLCMAKESDLENGKYYVDLRPERIHNKGDDDTIADLWWNKGLELIEQFSKGKGEESKQY